MNSRKRYSVALIAALMLVLLAVGAVSGQQRVEVLLGTDLARVVPPGFYFQGQSAPTQMRNSAAARFGSNRFVIAGMVDTSGYSADVRAKYEGFLITDSPITINGSALAIGAYGFGFSNDNKLTILDLSGKEIFSVTTKAEKQLRRPRPLVMTKTGNEIRLYSGREYVVIAAG